MGELGALICSDDICEVIPPYRVKAVDSTGAGDAFIGCFAVEYFRSSKIAEAVLLSNRYAALSATRPGTQKSYFSFAELTEMKR